MKSSKVLPVAEFHFKPATPIMGEAGRGSACDCSRLKDTCSNDRKITCAHVGHSFFSFSSDPGCYSEGCKRPIDGRGDHHHHKAERSKVMARLETQLQKDGLTYRETLPDGTMVYRRDAQ